MRGGVDELPGDVRDSTLASLRLRRPKLVRDLTNGLAAEPGFENVNLPDLAGILVTLLAAAVKAGWVDARTPSLQDLGRFSPPLGVRHLIRAVHQAERTALGELSLEEGIGGSADSWQIAARAISTAATEIILARQFFRTHDSVARHGGDSIAVLLPETPFDQGALLANQFREMVRSRLVLVEDKTAAAPSVSVSAAVVGTDLVEREFDHRVIVTEAEAAVVRAQMNGGNRLERVGLMPTSVTIPGAATLLGVWNREIARLLRSRGLTARRRGRHLHIDREIIDAYRHRN